MLVNNLKYLFKLRGVTHPISFLMNLGISRTVAHKLVHNQMSMVRFDHIEILCKKLVCTPNDLLLYIPSTPPDPHHPIPLEALMNKEEPGLMDKLKTMNIDQLKKVNKIIGSIDLDDEKM